MNPQHYAGTYRGQGNKATPAVYAEAIVEKAVELDVSVLAITDHNSVSDVPAFRNAAAGRDITILPGFELASTEGVHVLCIYPPNTVEEQLGRFLGEFGIREPKPSTKLCAASFAEVLEKVREQGGISIAAHSTSRSGGLFEVLRGQARVNAWRNEHLLAVQIPGSIASLPQNVRQIVENQNPDYLRGHVAGERQAVAVVNSRDIAKPEDLHESSATCWIKMSEVTIEGLRQAFLDPDSRIRLNSDSVPEEHTELGCAGVGKRWVLRRCRYPFQPEFEYSDRGAGSWQIHRRRELTICAQPRSDWRRRSQGSRGNRTSSASERDENNTLGTLPQACHA